MTRLRLILTATTPVARGRHAGCSRVRAPILIMWRQQCGDADRYWRQADGTQLRCDRMAPWSPLVMAELVNAMSTAGKT